MDEWYPIQVKQMDRVGRPDVDKVRGRRKHIVLIPLTVREILDEHIAQKIDVSSRPESLIPSGL
jgi:hypothetical protein